MNLKKTTVAGLLLSAAMLTSFVLVKGGKLSKFESSIEKKVGPKTIKVPYTEVVSYLDFAAKGTEDAIVDGKKFTYIYVWVPAVAPELGVRMMSPVGETSIKGATVTPLYTENSSSSDFFDTYITLEKSNITDAKTITAASVNDAKWDVLAKNDDSREMPKQPSGSAYNSLLRYKSQKGNPTKALSRGLYRVGFTTYKKGEVSGTFLAQIAAPVKLPGVIITRDLSVFTK